jgi:Protein of unknown function (DUF3995)
VNDVLEASTFLGAGVLASLGALHVSWARGGTWGSAAVIPTTSEGRPLFSPSPRATYAVGAALAAASGLYCGTAAGRRPSWVFRIGTFGAAIVLLARAVGDGRRVGFTKRIRDTPFARRDTFAFSPLCALLGFIGVLASC